MQDIGPINSYTQSSNLDMLDQSILATLSQVTRTRE